MIVFSARNIIHTVGGSQTEQCLCQLLSAFRFHARVHEILDICGAVGLFRGVDKVIRLDQNLVIHAVDPRQGVMMAYQIGDPLHLRFGHAGIGQKGPDDGWSFFFLQFSVGTAVFFSAEGTGNVVDDGGRLQQILSVRV